MSSPIVVVGSLNMDLVVHTSRHPQPGETLLGSDFETFPGGKGANQAVAAARAGGQVKMIGRVGDDAFGSSLRRTAANDGVDTTHILTTANTASGVALITLDISGQNTIVVASGANALLTAQDLLAAEAAFANAGVLLLQLETPLETVLQAALLARKHNLLVVLNPAPARPLPDSLLEQIDYLIPNESELSLLAGAPTVAGGIEALSARFSGALIVTLGGNGVLIAADGQRQLLPAHSVAVVDTVAAGDAFVGAFAVALAEGQSTLAAAALGNAAGAIAVTRPGAQPSLPTRAEIEALPGFSAAPVKAD